jgi:hypothetical protein
MPLLGVNMANLDSSQVLWRYHQWRCEYSPRTAERGVFRLYDANVRIIEAVCSRETATRDFAKSCRAMVETAENTRGGV